MSIDFYFGITFDAVEAAVWTAVASVEVAAGVSTAAVRVAVQSALVSIKAAMAVTTLTAEQITALVIQAIMQARISVNAYNHPVVVDTTTTGNVQVDA